MRNLRGYMGAKDAGFTLVELLVVLAIVGILIGLAVGGIRIVQQVNRDTQRKAIVRDMQLALEAFQEKHNKYPDSVVLSTDGDKTEIEATDGSDSEILTSEVSFEFGNWEVDDCSGFNPTGSPPGTENAEENSGNLTGCFEGLHRGYYLFVQLERTSTNYNASIAE